MNGLISLLCHSGYSLIKSGLVSFINMSGAVCYSAKAAQRVCVWSPQPVEDEPRGKE